MCSELIQTCNILASKQASKQQAASKQAASKHLHRTCVASWRSLVVLGTSPGCILPMKMGVMCTFQALGGSFGVSVPQNWSKMAPK